MSMDKRYNIELKEPRNENAKKQYMAEAKAIGLTHVPYPHIEKHMGHHVFSIPPGIAKQGEEKIEKWLSNNPRVKRWQPEGFGFITPVPSTTQGGSSLSLIEGDTNWQKFVSLAAAHTVTKGAGAVGCVHDNGINKSQNAWVAARIRNVRGFCSTQPGTTDGGSHGFPVAALAMGIVPDVLLDIHKAADSVTTKCRWNDMAESWLYAFFELGIQLHNCSYGGGSSFTAVDALLKIWNAGGVIFFASGNAGGATDFPARQTTCVSVSALNHSDDPLLATPAGFTNTGKVEFSAPGVGLDVFGSFFSGTSGASPIAFAISLLIKARNLTWTGRQCLEFMMTKCFKKDPTTTYGTGGIVNAALAVGAATDTPVPPVLDTMPPSVPTGLAVSNKTTTGFRLSWQESTDAQSGVASYDVMLNGERKVTLLKGSFLYWDFLDLVPGSTYLAEVTAKDKAGNVSAPAALTVTVPANPPPPVDDPAPQPTLQRLTPYAKVSITPSNVSPSNETIAHGTDQNIGTKCLIFVKAGTVKFEFTQGTDPRELKLMSANDFPVRDPKRVIATATLVTGEQQVLADTTVSFSARFQERTVPLTKASAAVVALDVWMESSGETSPGDRGQGILQFSELHPWGLLATTTPPPPPEETWTDKSEVVGTTYTLWSPAVVQQQRTRTDTVRTWQESNLGNVRNEDENKVETPENRNVPLPTA